MYKRPTCNPPTSSLRLTREKRGGRVDALRGERDLLLRERRVAVVERLRDAREGLRGVPEVQPGRLQRVSEPRALR